MSTELQEFSAMLDERFELADAGENESIWDIMISWFI